LTNIDKSLQKFRAIDGQIIFTDKIGKSKLSSLECPITIC